jgi:hypothetical protein
MNGMDDVYLHRRLHVYLPVAACICYRTFDY